ncbi:hypothetical protein JTE90_014380 [Oedothorax gibbosus]|uniref:Uncharacterized protein n=1 Tax=Oedothorax gibbosus TaxID=931172 RepID=A0AAV6TG45_9ARAC|nr:hypothetical protein JTE90_014380 [Oedothorax gibbosus]
MRGRKVSWKSTEKPPKRRLLIGSSRFLLTVSWLSLMESRKSARCLFRKPERTEGLPQLGRNCPAWRRIN